MIKSISTILDLNAVLLRFKFYQICLKMLQQVLNKSDFLEIEVKVFQKLFLDALENFHIMTRQALQIIFHAFLIIIAETCRSSIRR